MGCLRRWLIPNVVFIALLAVPVPESPRWLVENDRLRKAFGILARIGGRAVAEQELAQIRDAVGKEEGTLRELFRPGLRLALVVGLGLSIFGQMTGVNIVVYYGPSILEQAGMKLGSAMQYQVALGIINLIFTLVAIWKVDTWGRRPLLLWGMVVVTLTMGLTGVLFALNQTPAVSLAIVLSLCAVHGLRGAVHLRCHLDSYARDLPESHPRARGVHRRVRQLGHQCPQRVPVPVVCGAVRHARGVLHVRGDLRRGDGVLLADGSRNQGQEPGRN